MATIKTLFDPTTSTLTYVVYDETSRDAVIIDPVLDYDPLSSQTSLASAETLLAFVKDHQLNVHYVLETHAHADHLSSSQVLRKHLQAKVAIGETIRIVQETFKRVFDLPGLATDGSQFDELIADGGTLEAGTLRIRAIATPGHTPACMTYQIGDAVFTGDALFMPDYGTGRCDFPRGSADDLYNSVHDKLYALPGETRVFVGHDYQPKGRELAYETTIGEQKKNNVQLNAATTRDEYVKFRNERDATLNAPRLLYPSVQVNVNAGRLPAPHANGIRYLHLPLNMKTKTDDMGVPS
jgi:glyoxylase-like metal-dependent hydrolase (beta-lactamase superfamily II)